MSSAKTSTALGLLRHATTLRLTRIATLVMGCLVFLDACEVSRKSDLSDVRVQVAAAAGLALTGLITAWFEVRAANHAATRARTDIRGFLIESDGITVRARITRSGDLMFHGHDTNGAAAAYEWDWAFRATTFPAVRAALGGGRGDLLDLLEHIVPDLDRHDRYDPGAWLHNQDIPAAFRERGDTSHRITRELPVLAPEAPRRDPSRESTGTHTLPSGRHNAPDPVDPPHPHRSRDPDRPAATRRRAADPRSRNPRNSDNRFDEPPTRRGQPSDALRRASDRSVPQSGSPADGTGERSRFRGNESLTGSWDEQPDQHGGRGAPPSRHRTESPHDELDTPARAYREYPADPRSSPPSTDIPAGRFGEQPRWPEYESSGAHRQVLSRAHPSEPSRSPQREPWQRDEPSGRRHRRS